MEISESLECYLYDVSISTGLHFVFLILVCIVSTRMFDVWHTPLNMQRADKVPVCTPRSGIYKTVEFSNELPKSVGDGPSVIQIGTGVVSILKHDITGRENGYPHSGTRFDTTKDEGSIKPAVAYHENGHTTRSLIDIRPCHQSGICTDARYIKCSNENASMSTIDRLIGYDSVVRRIPVTWMIRTQKYERERKRLTNMVRDGERSNACKEYPWKWDIVHQINYRARLDAFCQNGCEPIYPERVKWGYLMYRDFACTKLNDKPCLLHSYMQLECIESYSEEDRPSPDDIEDRYCRDEMNGQESPHEQSGNGMRSVRFRNYDSSYAVDNENPHGLQNTSSVRARRSSYPS